MIEKWGKPTHTNNEKIQNKTGETANKVVDVWLKKDRLISYMRDPSGDKEVILYSLATGEAMEMVIKSIAQDKLDVRKGL